MHPQIDRFDNDGPTLDPHGKDVDSADAPPSYWRLETLNDITGRLLKGRDPNDEVLPALFELVGEEYGIDCIYSYWLSKFGDRLQLAFAGGKNAADCREHPGRLRFGEGLCGMAALMGEAMHATNIQSSVEPRLAHLKASGFTAYACEPVKVDGRLFGVVAFASRSLPRFESADLLFFQSIARHIALAVDRAERIHELEGCNRELQHRVNNVLSTVQSLAVLGSRSASGPEEFSRAFSERLTALGRTHSLLTRQGQTARLRDILCAELRPFDEPGRVRLRGPSVRLADSLAIFVGIAIHELVANSAAHGSLATEHGTLQVSWGVPERGCRRVLTIDWQETGGQPVVEPVRRGFGSRLLDGGLGRQIRVRRNFTPVGLHATIEVILD